MIAKNALPLFLFLLIIGCVPQSKYTETLLKYEDTNAQNEKLKQQTSEKEKAIQALREDKKRLTQKMLSLVDENSRLKSEMNKLQKEYTKATQTAEYYFQKGIDLMNSHKYPAAYEQFTTVKQKFPNSKEYKQAQKQLTKLTSISSNNISKIKKLLKKEKVAKNKLTIIEREQKQTYLTKTDSTKLAQLYNNYTIEYEAERFVTVQDDKMQSCYFYETSRYTVQKVKGVNLRFEAYCVKNYSGGKYLRLRTRYSADDWMFYKNITVRGSNGVKFSFNTDYPEKQSNNSNYGVSEWSDNKATNYMKNKLIQISKAENIYVRFDGQYRYDMMLNEEQLKAFKEIVSKYQKI